MTDALDAAGLPTELGALDYLLHRGEAHPRTRSGIMVVEILDKAPGWDRFVDTFENASRRVLRLRQKVVVPTWPTAAPRWVIDPDFNLDYHVRRLRVPEPGTLREVFDLAEVMLQSPLDISRALWTATLVEGLRDGQAAVLLHMSHAVTDGVGAVEMFANFYDLERDPPPKEPAPHPIPQDLSPNDLARAGLNRLPGAVVGGVWGAIFGAAQVVGRVVRNPLSAVTGVVDYARSGARVLGLAAEPSPLLRRRSLSTRSEAIDIDFAAFRTAAKAAEGSINDAYLAGLCGALRRYHDASGMAIDSLPMAVPVNLRAPRRPHWRDPRADVPGPRGAGHRRAGRNGATAQCGAGSVGRIGRRVDRQLGCTGQQCPGVPRRHLPGRREGAATVRSRAIARCGHDGHPGVSRRNRHGDNALRPGLDHRRRPVRAVPVGRLQRGAGTWRTR